MNLDQKKLAFGKKNYRMMLLSLLVLVVGFTVMSLDTADYGFGALGLTIGPIIVLIGFIMQFFAILYAKKSDSE